MSITTGLFDTGFWIDYKGESLSGLEGEWDQDLGNGDMTHWCDLSSSVYTVLAYRPNAIDTDKVRFLQESDSNFEFKIFENLDDAAKYWASKQYGDTLKTHYGTWDLALLVDGYDNDDLCYKIDALAKPYLLALKDVARLKREAVVLKQASLEAARLKSKQLELEAAEYAIYLKVQERLKNGS